MKIYSITHSAKIRLLGRLALFLGMDFWVYTYFSLIWSYPLFWNNTSLTIFLFLFGLISCGVLWLFLLLYTTQKARLVFDERGVQLQSLEKIPGFLLQRYKPFDLPYDQIQFIQPMWLAGLLVCTLRNGREQRLSVGDFAARNGESILQEFATRLPAAVFLSGIEIPTLRKRWGKVQNLRSALLILYFALFFCTFVANLNFPILGWFVSAWNMKMPLSGEQLWYFSRDPQDQGFWLLAREYDGEYTAYRYDKHLSPRWKLPELKDRPAALSGDPQGNPLVWMPFDFLLRYQQGKWEKVFYKSDLDFKPEIDSLYTVVSGSDGWFLDSIRHRRLDLFHADGVTGVITQIPLPDKAENAGLSPSLIRQAPNGDLWLLLQTRKLPWVYEGYVMNRQNQWSEIRYPISVEETRYSVDDIFIDRQGFLWALIVVTVGKDEWLVERIAPDGSFSVSYLPPLKSGKNYDRIFIDDWGRLWVTCPSDEYILSMLPQWGSNAVELQRYTGDNSNYPGRVWSYGLWMDQDGLIWAFDPKIATIDTTQVELPQPLPDWWLPKNLDIVRSYSFLLIFVWAVTGVGAAYTRIQPAKK